jgi:hypothetical protein
VVVGFVLHKLVVVAVQLLQALEHVLLINPVVALLSLKEAVVLPQIGVVFKLQQTLLVQQQIFVG